MAFRIYSFCETPPGVIKAVDCGIGTAGESQYSYFNSEILSNNDFRIDFPGDVLTVIQPDLPSGFLLYNLASSSTSSGITSSGANLQFIDTAQAGKYEFHVHFSLQNPVETNTKPDVTLTLGTPAATPYTNANTGFFQIATEFEATTLAGLQGQVYIASMHGVVDLPVLSTTAVLIKPGAQGQEFDFGTFNVTVKKLE